MKTSIFNNLTNAMTYQEYKDLVKNLYAQGRSTAEEDNQELVDFSRLNLSRMKRLDKTTVLPNKIKSKVDQIDKHIEWVVLSEGWCGDAAQNLPTINAIAELNENINLKIVLRDQNPELMNEYLTNGAKAVPKLIQLQDGEVTATWGPRPEAATKMVQEFKKKHNGITPEFKEELQVWYNKNKSESLINDLIQILN